MRGHFNAIAYRDVLFSMILGLVILMGIIILTISIKAKEQTESAEPPGNLIVHIVWPTGDTDIDLWVDGPGEILPVGYSNKGGKLWNLLRDDLGNYPDATGINYEDAFTRGVVPGDYTINAMCYHCPTFPQEVSAEVSVNTGEPGKSSLKVLVTSKLKLTKQGQERTLIRFTLLADGTIKPGSMNSVFKPLRDGKK